MALSLRDEHFTGTAFSRGTLNVNVEALASEVVPVLVCSVAAAKVFFEGASRLVEILLVVTTSARISSNCHVVVAISDKVVANIIAELKVDFIYIRCALTWVLSGPVGGRDILAAVWRGAVG